MQKNLDILGHKIESIKFTLCIKVGKRIFRYLNQLSTKEKISWSQINSIMKE